MKKRTVEIFFIAASVLFLCQSAPAVFANPQVKDAVASTKSMDSTIREHCDYPLGEVDSKPAKDSAVCLDLCQKNTACRAFTFISGWNRCLMRSKLNLKNGVIMHGGSYLPKESSSPVREVVTYGPGFDHRGKDLLKVPSSPTEVACQASCKAHSSCVGYVWISGYNDCWLKKTHGEPLAKKFYCGQVRD
jgi:hypothetical protein